MDEEFLCECGCNQFFYFGVYVRCCECLNEMKLVLNQEAGELEHWMRRLKISDNYIPRFSNWEKIPTSSSKWNKGLKEVS